MDLAGWISSHVSQLVFFCLLTKLSCPFFNQVIGISTNRANDLGSTILFYDLWNLWGNVGEMCNVFPPENEIFSFQPSWASQISVAEENGRQTARRVDRQMRLKPQSVQIQVPDEIRRCNKNLRKLLYGTPWIGQTGGKRGMYSSTTQPPLRFRKAKTCHPSFVGLSPHSVPLNSVTQSYTPLIFRLLCTRLQNDTTACSVLQRCCFLPKEKYADVYSTWKY